MGKTIFKIICYLAGIGLLVFLTLQIPYVWDKFFEVLNSDLSTLLAKVELGVWGLYMLIVCILVPLLDIMVIVLIVLSIICWFAFKDTLNSLFKAIYEALNQ